MILDYDKKEIKSVNYGYQIFVNFFDRLFEFLKEEKIKEKYEVVKLYFFGVIIIILLIMVKKKYILIGEDCNI